MHGQHRLPNSSLSPLPSLQTTALHVDLTFADRPFTAAYFSTWIVPLLAVSIDCSCNIHAQGCKESVFFDSGQIASNDLSGRTHARTHACTDNCKISIMMIVYCSTQLLSISMAMTTLCQNVTSFHSSLHLDHCQQQVVIWIDSDSSKISILC